MSFLWPISLFSLFAIPLLVLLYLRMQNRRKQFAVRYGSLGLVQQATNGRALGSRRHLPAILFLIGLTILFFALARPQMPVSLPTVEGIVILAFAGFKFVHPGAGIDNELGVIEAVLDESQTTAVFLLRSGQLRRCGIEMRLRTGKQLRRVFSR